MENKTRIFRITPQKFEDVDPTLLRYSKACKEGHCDSQGRGARLVKSGVCLACRYDLPDGPYSHNFGDKVAPKKSWKKFTDEEGKARHIKRVMQWQKDNRDKVKPVQQKYNAKEEVKQRSRDAYQAKKAAKQKRQREYYQANKDAILARQQELYYEKNKDIILARQRAAYARKHPKFDNIAFDTAPYDQA